ncbi:MAG: hypothetical protein HY587_06220 [Candidatus Omnitrophica bacterium]|nr:hypothetical protein [Candidatus Omnitrophota bacterium]
MAMVITLPVPAYSLAAGETKMGSPLFDPSSIQIPENLGKVEETFRGSSDQLVIYIQDAHTNYSAQRNIAAIVDKFVADYGIRLVSVEAAQGEIETELFRAFPIPEATERVMDKLLRKGEIGGPQYASITGRTPFDFVGVDRAALYKKNLNEFLSVLADRELGRSFISKARIGVKQLKTVLYSKEARELDRLIETHSSQFTDLLSFLNQLHARAEELGMPLDNYAHLGALMKFAGKLKSGEMSEDAVREEFKTVDPIELFNEIESISFELKYKLAQSKEARELIRLEHYLTLLEHGFSLELTREQAIKLKGMERDFGRDKIISFFETLSKRHRLNDSYLEGMRFISLDDFTARIFRFYGTTAEREKEFEKLLKKEMLMRLERSAVLVTGGFHRDGVLKRLRDANISYAVITPAIQELTDHEKYLDLMRTSGELLSIAPVTHNIGVAIPSYEFGELGRQKMGAMLSAQFSEPTRDELEEAAIRLNIDWLLGTNDRALNAEFLRGQIFSRQMNRVGAIVVGDRVITPTALRPALLKVGRGFGTVGDKRRMLLAAVSRAAITVPSFAITATPAVEEATKPESASAGFGAERESVIANPPDFGRARSDVARFSLRSLISGWQRHVKRHWKGWAMAGTVCIAGCGAPPTMPGTDETEPPVDTTPGTDGTVDETDTALDVDLRQTESYFDPSVGTLAGIAMDQRHPDEAAPRDFTQPAVVAQQIFNLAAVVSGEESTIFDGPPDAEADLGSLVDTLIGFQENLMASTAFDGLLPWMDVFPDSRPVADRGDSGKRATFIDNIYLTLAMESVRGAFAKTGRENHPTATQALRFITNQREGYRKLYDSNRGLLRFGIFNDGRFMDGHVDRLVQETAPGIVYVIARYGISENALTQLYDQAVDVVSSVEIDGKNAAFLKLRPDADKSFQGELPFTVGTWSTLWPLDRWPLWERIYRSTAEVVLDYLRRNGLTAPPAPTTLPPDAYALAGMADTGIYGEIEPPRSDLQAVYGLYLLAAQSEGATRDEYVRRIREWVDQFGFLGIGNADVLVNSVHTPTGRVSTVALGIDLGLANTAARGRTVPELIVTGVGLDAGLLAGMDELGRKGTESLEEALDAREDGGFVPITSPDTPDDNIFESYKKAARELDLSFLIGGDELDYEQAAEVLNIFLEALGYEIPRTGDFGFYALNVIINGEYGIGTLGELKIDLERHIQEQDGVVIRSRGFGAAAEDLNVIVRESNKRLERFVSGLATEKTFTKLAIPTIDGMSSTGFKPIDVKPLDIKSILDGFKMPESPAQFDFKLSEPLLKIDWKSLRASSVIVDTKERVSKEKGLAGFVRRAILWLAVLAVDGIVRVLRFIGRAEAARNFYVRAADGIRKTFLNVYTDHLRMNGAILDMIALARGGQPVSARDVLAIIESDRYRFNDTERDELIQMLVSKVKVDGKPFFKVRDEYKSDASMVMINLLSLAIRELPKVKESREEQLRLLGRIRDLRLERADKLGGEVRGARLKGAIAQLGEKFGVPNGRQAYDQISIDAAIENLRLAEIRAENNRRFADEISETRIAEREARLARAEDAKAKRLAQRKAVWERAEEQKRAAASSAIDQVDIATIAEEVLSKPRGSGDSSAGDLTIAEQEELEAVGVAIRAEAGFGAVAAVKEPARTISLAQQVISAINNQWPQIVEDAAEEFNGSLRGAFGDSGNTISSLWITDAGSLKAFYELLKEKGLTHLVRNTTEIIPLREAPSKDYLDEIGSVIGDRSVFPLAELVPAGKIRDRLRQYRGDRSVMVVTDKDLTIRGPKGEWVSLTEEESRMLELVPELFRVTIPSLQSALSNYLALAGQTLKAVLTAA